MGLPWRFISASAGMVTFVMGARRGAEFAPSGKGVRLMVVSTAAPITQDAARTRRVYARRRGRVQRGYPISVRWGRGASGHQCLPFLPPALHTGRHNADSMGNRNLGRAGRVGRAGAGGGREFRT